MALAPDEYKKVTHEIDVSTWNGHTRDIADIHLTVPFNKLDNYCKTMLFAEPLFWWAYKNDADFLALVKNELQQSEPLEFIELGALCEAVFAHFHISYTPKKNR